jgi:hypothetical protein
MSIALSQSRFPTYVRVLRAFVHHSGDAVMICAASSKRGECGQAFKEVQ